MQTGQGHPKGVPALIDSGTRAWCLERKPIRHQHSTSGHQGTGSNRWNHQRHRRIHGRRQGLQPLPLGHQHRMPLSGAEFEEQPLAVGQQQFPGLLQAAAAHRCPQPHLLLQQLAESPAQVLVVSGADHSHLNVPGCQHAQPSVSVPMPPNPKPAPLPAEESDVVVIGAGVAGLTAAALLADAGLTVELLEAHRQSGGCAGTFRRGPYVFDVGATQVAGLEPEGSHHRLCRHLGIPLPDAHPLDPGCVVQLSDGSEPISLWRDPERWRQEQQRQFPGSQRFWALCAALHQANWAFAGKDPVLPPRTLWDLGQLIGALGPAQLATGVLAKATVADLLRLCGCAHDQRLHRFLDLQLRLYSQHGVDRTAALYGATVLAMAQAPLGLWHLHGSMQTLSDGLEIALARAGGQLRLRHRVTALKRTAGLWTVSGMRASGEPFQCRAGSVVCTLPPQTLPALLGEDLPSSYHHRLQTLPTPSGALVFYGAIERSLLPDAVPSHLQLEAGRPGSLFVSVSQEGDGRAPSGEATVIASVFTPSAPWFHIPEADYQRRKEAALADLQSSLEEGLKLPANAFKHRELATPRGFAGWTGRPFGMVGGLGQTPEMFGPFGLASRTPLPGLWLCGDSIHPGEGTAGVSLSALMASRQLLAERGTPLQLRS